MRITVMAAGAVGGYFGGRMAAAGHDVAFIARGAHRDAIRRDGLKIESALGDLHLKDVNVTDDPTQVGPVDVVLFAVKPAGDICSPRTFSPIAPRRCYFRYSKHGGVSDARANCPSRTSTEG
jgi:2-dehydropantoate 2-reductase